MAMHSGHDSAQSDQRVVSEQKRKTDWPNDLGFHYMPQDNAPIRLRITGKFPEWTAGSLLRIGPGANEVDRSVAKDGKMKISHWFDGFTTLHKFSLNPAEDGSIEVTYMSKGQVDDQIEIARQTGRMNGISFGQKRDPCESLYRKLKTVFEPTATTFPTEENVGVTFSPSHHSPLGNVISTTSDKSVLKEIDLETLEAKSLTRSASLHPDLKGPMSAAHACRDPKNDDIYNYNLDFGPKSVYRIFRTRAKDGVTEIIATISGSDIKGAYIHSFFLTEHFVILCIWPAYFAKMGISILWERNLLDALEKFNSSSKCVWLVVDRCSGKGVVKKFTSPAMFCFHTVNAWEEERDDGSFDVTADLVQFDDAKILNAFYYENLMSSGPGAGVYQKSAATLARYRLSSIKVPGSSASSKSESKTGEAECVLRIKEPLAGDLPSINPAYSTRPSRYVYSIIDRGHSSFVDAVGKTDIQTKESKLWSCDKHTPGEPIFIANPEAKSEDDGVLLVVVLDGIKGTSYLLCLDAISMTEVARAECDVPVSFGFHGVHLKNNKT